MATIISPRADGCRRATSGLRASDCDPGIEGDAWSSRADQSGAIEIEFAAGVRMRITADLHDLKDNEKKGTSVHSGLRLTATTRIGWR